MTTPTPTYLRGHRTTRALRTRPLRLLVLVAVMSALIGPGVAQAYTEGMGPARLSTNSYIQTAGAHTFKQATGSSYGAGTWLACQLRNDSGVNVVDHGYAFCLAFWYGTAYVWGRVYNQSAFIDTVSGSATT